MTTSTRTLSGLMEIEKRVGKSENESATDRLGDQRAGLREIDDGLSASLDLIKKRRSETGAY